MAKFAELTVELELQQAQFNRGMDQAARSLARVQQSAAQSQRGLAGLEKSMAAIGQAAVAMGTAFAAFEGLKAISAASASIANLQGSLVALLGSSERAGDMFRRVFDVAARTGAPIDATASAITRLTIALEPMGASNSQISTLTENFIKLGRVGGSSAEDVANALRQLSQGLASGSLAGDELKSIRENVPLVAKAIADGLGVPIGKLKELGEQGKLTGPVVANALLAVTDKVNAAFAQMPVTLEQALNKMTAQATLAAAAIDKSGSITSTLVIAVDHIADTIKRWRTELEPAGTQLSATQILVQSLGDMVRVVAVAFVAIGFALEQITKRTAFWAQQLKLMVEMDWSGVLESSRLFQEQLDASAEAADRTIKALLGLKVPQLQSGETGGEPLITTKKLTGGGAPAGHKGKSEAEREAEAIAKRGEALAAAVDPLNAYNQKLIEYQMLLDKAAISDTTFALAKKKAREELTATGDALTAAVDPLFAHEQQLRKINEAYMNGSIEVETFIKWQEKLQKELDAQTKQELPIEQLQKDAEAALSGGVGQFFKDVIEGSMTAEKAFTKMVEQIIRDLAKLLAEFAAKQAAKFIINAIGGGAGGSVGGKAIGNAAGSLMLARVPTWSPRASLAGPFSSAAVPFASGGSSTGAAGKAGAWQVVINNNAGPGVDVRAQERPDGALEVVVDRVRAALAQDVARGGNPFARSIEQAYGVGRGR